MADKALIEAAIQHVKAMGPNSYEEWVGLIIDIACAENPTLRPGERSPDTPALVPLSYALTGKATRP